MNNAIGKLRKRRALHHSKRPQAIALRVHVPATDGSWSLPVKNLAAFASAGDKDERVARIPATFARPEPQRVELNLIRSVAQSALRRNRTSGPVWGR